MVTVISHPLACGLWGDIVLCPLLGALSMCETGYILVLCHTNEDTMTQRFLVPEYSST